MALYLFTISMYPKSHIGTSDTSPRSPLTCVPLAFIIQSELPQLAMLPWLAGILEHQLKYQKSPLGRDYMETSQPR